MKLLIITQKIDRDDQVLGFFHNWILGLASKFEQVSVVCLEKGVFSLPSNVSVYSLGKESGRSKWKYVKNFYLYIMGLHRDYDAVFIHMNQEYVLLGGIIWKLMRRKVYMWRNHIYGNLFTRLAVLLSDKVFCTSEQSFTARFKKTVLMPVGVDTEIFREGKIERRKNSILSLGRIGPVKNIHLLVETLNILRERGVQFEADVYGDALSKDKQYFDDLKLKARQINFHSGVLNYKTPEIYQSHEIFVNLTPSGSFDKTILEAALCGCITVISNKSIEGEIPPNLIAESSMNIADIAEKIEYWINAPENLINETSEKLQSYVRENHSLEILMDKLQKEITL